MISRKGLASKLHDLKLSNQLEKETIYKMVKIDLYELNANVTVRNYLFFKWDIEKFMRKYDL